MQRRGRRRWADITVWVILFAFIFGGVIFFTPGGLQIFDFDDGPPEEPAIVVNGDEISINDLDFASYAAVQQWVNLYNQSNLGNFNEQLVGAQGAKRRLNFTSDSANQLINETLLLSEADRRGIRVPNTELDPAFRDVYDSTLQTFNPPMTHEDLRSFLGNSQGRGQFAQVLAQAGFMNLRTGTINEFRDELRRREEINIKQEKLREEIVGLIDPSDLELLDYIDENQDTYLTKIVGPYVPTDEEIVTFFDENRDNFIVEQAKIRHIQISVPEDATPDDTQSYSQKIERVKAELDGGRDFADLAISFSDDPVSKLTNGEIDFFSHGESLLDTEDDSSFSDAVFAQNIGVVEIVESSKGFHILEVLEKRFTEFEEVEDDVKQTIIDEMQFDRFSSWLEASKSAVILPPLEEVKARHILVNLALDAPDEDVQSISRKIDRIVSEYEGGEDFGDLARKYSQDDSNKSLGGDLGWFGHGSMVDEFDQAAFALEIDEVSEPVRTQYGFHLIQLQERRTTEDFNEVVKGDYTRAEEETRFENWLEETRESATVEYKDLLLEAYKIEMEAQEVEDDLDLKIDLYLQAIDAYETAKADISADPFIGFYQSEAHRRVVDLLEEKLADLGDEITEEERLAIDTQIAEQRVLVSSMFLESSYTEPDSFVFERTVSEDKENADLRFRYGVFLRDHENEDDEAYDQFLEVLRIDPEFWRARVQAAAIQVARESYTSAIELLATAQTQAPAESREERLVRFSLANAYLERGIVSENPADLNEAKTLMLVLREEFPPSDRNYPVLLTFLGDAFMELNEHEDAEQAYRDSLQQSSRNDVEVKLGLALLAQDKLDEAERTLNRIAVRDVYSLDARIALGDVLVARGEIESAIDNYLDALALNGTNETLIEIAEKILALNPDDVDTRYTLAELYTEERIVQRAIDEYQLILDADATSWRAQKGLGDSYNVRTEYRTAMDFYKSSLLNEPPTSEQIAINENIVTIEEILVGNENPYGPDGQEALVNLAELYARQGNQVKSRENLDILTEQYPDFETERVAAVLQEIETTAEVGSDGLPGVSVPDQGRGHIDPGSGHEPYASIPPTSGEHYPNTTSYGIHTQPITAEIQVHNLEHGGVIISYDQDANEQLKGELLSYVNGLRTQELYCKVMLAPYENLGSELAITAWNRVLKLEEFDEDILTGFIDEFINEGPERIADCRL
jgi:parvulin-like peptidyl-prolyl isomerase/tetratricopeptide (TPR) repeat protein